MQAESPETLTGEAAVIVEVALVVAACAWTLPLLVSFWDLMF